MDFHPLAILHAKLGEKEELQKIQSPCSSLNFSYPEMQHQIRSLSGRTTGGKLLLFGFSLVQTQTFSFWIDPHEAFHPLLNQIRRLFATYPGSLITVSHDRRFLKRCAVQSSISNRGTWSGGS